MAFDLENTATADVISTAQTTSGRDLRAFFVVKRAIDIFGAAMLLMFMIPVALVLLVLNPFFNRGPLFFLQERMGKDCETFTAIKFRSMVPAETIARTADCPLEVDRITPLGRFLRKSRLDEFPQAINVLRNDMSLIGPRPDYIEYARHYIAEVPGYRERHSVRPGISGRAQVEVGYVAGTEATHAKVRADLAYIRELGFAEEMRLIWRSVETIISRRGD